MIELSEVLKLRADLRAAAVVIDTAYGILNGSDEYEVVERAKEVLKAYIVDQIKNGGYKQR